MKILGGAHLHTRGKQRRGGCEGEANGAEDEKSSLLLLPFNVH
jgi:hypothetical protein